MTTKQIENIEKDIRTLITNHRLHDAFALIKNTAEGAMQWEITDEISRIEQSYAYMLRYLTDGTDDPDRNRLLDDIIARSNKVVDSLIHRLGQTDTPSLYYSTLRYETRAGMTVAQCIAKFTEAAKMVDSVANLFATAKTTDETTYAETFRKAEIELFNRVWTSFPLNGDDAKVLVDIITSAATTRVTAIRLTSALSLALTEMFDERAFEALIDIYSHYAVIDTKVANEISTSALIGLLIALFKYNGRTLSTSLSYRIGALSEIPIWASDVKSAFTEIARSRDTERINRTIHEAIIPGMMALRPEIEKKMRDPNFRPESLENLQDNPEWDELLSKSGISDKLRELSEMQMDGSDVFMSTFSHLKNFSFFSDVIGWFTPFDHSVREVEQAVTSNPELGNVCATIEAMPFLCDSDKYSMMLSVDMIPKAQRDMILSQANNENRHFEDLRNELVGITRADQRRFAIRNHMRNLYRFLNLFRRKGEFYNVFTHGANMLTVPALKSVLEDVDFLNVIGEFYFKRGYYTDAIEAFGILDNLGEFSATLYQKMGYAYERNGDLDAAMRYYEQADLLDSSSKWTKMRLATVYRAKGLNDDAIRILLKTAETNPDDIEIIMMLGYTYVRVGNYREALKRFYQAEFIDEQSHRTLRPIAWSLFMTGDFDKAAEYYERIIFDQPTGEDYLNMGHTALARSMFKDAVYYYKLYILADGNSKESFFEALKNDREHLDTAGIDSSTISLIADAMLYDLAK